MVTKMWVAAGLRRALFAPAARVERFARRYGRSGGGEAPGRGRDQRRQRLLRPAGDPGRNRTCLHHSCRACDRLDPVQAFLMRNLMKRWRQSLDARRQRRFAQELFADGTNSPSRKRLRKWSDERLSEHLVQGTLWPVSLRMAEAELRRREAWRAPAGWAFWISLLALLISAGALAMTIWGM